MIANRNFEHCQPLTWVGQKPVYLATAIAVAHGVTMILTALGTSLYGRGSVENLFGFSFPGAIANLHLWQFITYAFVNQPDIMTAFQIIMLAIFGSEVEKFLGRKSFAWLYALLVVGLPVFLLILDLVHLVPLDYSLPGSSTVNFAVFLSFVFIYPKAEIFFTIQARWIAAVLLAIYTLQSAQDHDWAGLSLLWLEGCLAVLWLMKEGVHSFPLPSWSTLRREHHSKKKLRVVKRAPAEPESIDPILEKIARQGLGSLTRAERDQLERARTALLEKERTG